MSKQHHTLTGADLHEPKAHASSHYATGADDLTSGANGFDLRYATYGHTHSTYVPYTGATTTVNLGAQALTTTGNVTCKNLVVSSATYPPASCTRTSSATNTNLAGVAVTHQTTGDMVDGFGTAFAFNIIDSAGVTNVLGAIGAIRDGADNTGALVFDTRILNNQSTKMKIFGAGTMRILNAGSAVNYADFTVDTSGDLSITANGGDISFGDENLLTTGTFGAGAITGTSFTIGANTLTTAEWANLDGINQTLATTSSPTFANITDSGLTATHMVYAGTSGLLSGSANNVWNNTTQTQTVIGGHRIVGKASFQATGTVTYVNTSKTINGIGTSFLTEVKIGDYVWNKSSYATPELALAANAIDRVDTIVSDTQIIIRANSFQPPAPVTPVNMGIAPCLLNMADYLGANATISGDPNPGFNGVYVDYFMNMYPAGSVVMANLKTLDFTGNGIVRSTSSGSNVRLRATDGTNNIDFVVIPNTYEFNINPSQINADTLFKGSWNNAGANAVNYHFILSAGDAGDSADRGAGHVTVRGGNSRGANTSGGGVWVKTGEALASSSTLQTYYTRLKFNIGLAAGGEGAVFNPDQRDYDLRGAGATDANLFILDASDDAVKIAGATTSKVGFYGVTPVDQPLTVSDAATQDLTGTDTINRAKTEADLTSCKNAANAIIDRLQELGLIA